MLHNNKKKRYGVIMVLIIILLGLVPFLLGMNPYTVVKSVCTRLYWQSIYARNGLSVTQNDTYFGLRGQDSAILDTKYTQFENLDKKGNYIAAKQIGERDSESEIWVIFCERSSTYSCCYGAPAPGLAWDMIPTSQRRGLYVLIPLKAYQSRQVG